MAETSDRLLSTAETGGAESLRKERAMVSAPSGRGDVLPPAWIEVLDETDADEVLAAAYAACGDSATGRVAHIMQVHSLHPQSMLDHRALYETLLFGRSPLKRYQREMIGTVVSAANECRY